MAEYESNKKIKKVYKGKLGESEYGPWQAWNFYLEGVKDIKFSYFSGGDKPVPVEGRMVKHIEYEVVTKDGYTNNNVKKLVYYPREPDNEPRQEPDQGPPGDYEPPGELPKNPPTSQKPDSSISFYVSYAKDLMVAMIERDGMPESLPSLTDAADEVVRVGTEMWRKVNGGN